MSLATVPRAGGQGSAGHCSPPRRLTDLLDSCRLAGAPCERRLDEALPAGPQRLRRDGLLLDGAHPLIAALFLLGSATKRDAPSRAPVGLYPPAFAFAGPRATSQLDYVPCAGCRKEAYIWANAVYLALCLAAMAAGALLQVPQADKLHVHCAVSSLPLSLLLSMSARLRPLAVLSIPSLNISLTDI